jgi:hypothetical protein
MPTWQQAKKWNRLTSRKIDIAEKGESFSELPTLLVVLKEGNKQKVFYGELPSEPVPASLMRSGLCPTQAHPPLNRVYLALPGSLQLRTSPRGNWYGKTSRSLNLMPTLAFPGE